MGDALPRGGALRRRAGGLRPPGANPNRRNAEEPLLRTDDADLRSEGLQAGFGKPWSHAGICKHGEEEGFATALGFVDVAEGSGRIAEGEVHPGDQGVRRAASGLKSFEFAQHGRRLGAPILAGVEEPEFGGDFATQNWPTLII